jgi:opacity protein-like surface antigen
MKKVETFCAALLAVAANAVFVHAQAGPAATRFAISGFPILAKPSGDFSRNVGSAFGGSAAVAYYVDRPGILSLRFDVSGVPYGRESRRVPVSGAIGDRILLDLTTTNWMTAFNFGPELALPRGPLRPYVNGGLSRILFRTSSWIKGSGSNDAFATTKNYSDSTGAWFLGGGVRIPLAGNDPRRALSLDLGIRYQHGGSVSYLREGSIQDNPDGTIRFTPLVSGTPQMIYVAGVRFRIPHNPATGCGRFLC